MLYLVSWCFQSISLTNMFCVLHASTIEPLARCYGNWPWQPVSAGQPCFFLFCCKELVMYTTAPGKINLVRVM